jgi:hypothetical protein
MRKKIHKRKPVASTGKVGAMNHEDPLARTVADRIIDWCSKDYARLSVALKLRGIRVNSNTLRKRLERAAPLPLAFLNACAEAMGISLPDLVSMDLRAAKVWRTTSNFMDYAQALFTEQKAARSSAVTLVFGHVLTLRVVPQDLYAVLHDRLFEPLGERAKALRREMNGLKEHIDEEFSSLDPGAIRKLHNLLITSDWEKLFLRHWPYDRFTAEQVLCLVTHLQQEWIDRRGYRLYLIDDAQLSKRPGLLSILKNWQTLAAVSQNLAIRQSLDYEIMYSDSQAVVNETFTLLEKIRDNDRLARPADFEFYEAWARALHQKEERQRAPIVQNKP